MQHRTERRTRQEQGADAPLAVRRGPKVGGLHRARAEPLPCQIDAPRGWTAPEDVSRHADGSMGDLAFLARFAFGRY